MARRAVCGLWPDCDPCMNEDGDWILILTPPPPSPPPQYEGRDRTEHVGNKCVLWRDAQVANNSMTVMQDSLFYQSNYSAVPLLSFVGT